MSLLSDFNDAALARLRELHPKVIDLSLGRIERLLARLGNPQKSLAPVIHVAGTNGKGSLIAFLRAMLEAAAYRVQAYTSPHLVRFEERIRLVRGNISPHALAEILEKCETANKGDPITFFEITTAAAFLAFAEEKADVLLLETGLGGRLDATNLVDRPALTAITPVSMDHRDFLGSSITEVMAEKAGILKPGTRCVSAAQEASAMEALAARAKMLEAPIFVEGKNWSVKDDGNDGDGFSFKGEKLSGHFPRPALCGPHQVRNAALAIACLERLEEFSVPDKAISVGLEKVNWLARLQRLSVGPFVDALPENWELWLDGGHNEAAGHALAGQAKLWRDRPLDVILAMKKNKDQKAFLKPMAGDIRRLVSIPLVEGGADVQDLVGSAKSLGIDAKAAENPGEALNELVSAKEPGRILICGSLYLAGDILTQNG
jgi:dihydrofolate synthase / folylpolyglutamate synthase